MYKYDFIKNDEIIVTEYIDIPTDIDDKRILVNILITDKNILLFQDITKNNPLKSYIYEIPQYELVISIDKNIKKENYNNADNHTQINIENKKIIIYKINVFEWFDNGNLNT